LLGLGAKVISVDIAGVDICKENINHNNSLIIQADITDLLFKKASFDIVWCHRVLQHTPNPEKTLNHILSFVKPNGAVFIHSYARTIAQMISWKYILRPFTSKMNKDKLFLKVEKIIPILFKDILKNLKTKVILL